jgi:hypothetical protein
VDEICRYSDDMTDVSHFLSYLPASSAFPSLYSVPYFTWKIARNPFGYSASFLRTRNGRPAAHLSVTAKPGNASLLGGARFGEMCDAHTHPQSQGQGHFGAVAGHTAKYFEEAGPGDSLIIAAPNANSLPGFLRHARCRVFDEMRLNEMRLPFWRRPWQWIIDMPARITSRTTVERAGDVASTAKMIDSLWEEAASAGWLVSKSGVWWRWRYAEATERYATYLIRVGAELRGWAVVKQTATLLPLVGRTAICDVVGVTPEVEVSGLEALLRSVAGPIDVVTMWTQSGTPLGDAAVRLGFSPVRVVPIVVVENAALRQLKSADHAVRLALGDTDNV